MSNATIDISKEKLPLPRLQITWEEIPEDKRKGHLGCNWLARYELLLPVKGQVRDSKSKRRPVGKSYVVDGVMHVPLGGQRRQSEAPPDKYGEVDTPFRDGCHIKWDAFLLRLPAYAVFGNKATQQLPSEPLS